MPQEEAAATVPPADSAAAIVSCGAIPANEVPAELGEAEQVPRAPGPLAPADVLVPHALPPGKQFMPVERTPVRAPKRVRDNRPECSRHKGSLPWAVNRLQSEGHRVTVATLTNLIVMGRVPGLPDQPAEYTDEVLNLIRRALTSINGPIRTPERPRRQPQGPGETVFEKSVRLNEERWFAIERSNATRELRQGGIEVTDQTLEAFAAGGIAAAREEAAPPEPEVQHGDE